MAVHDSRRRASPPRWINRLVLLVLRSPAHALLDARICALTYRLQPSGRVVSLPVRYVAFGDAILVAVGNANAKAWWRAFRRPRPVSVLLRGHLRQGIGRVLGPSDPGHAAALLTYGIATGVTMRPDTPFVALSGLGTFGPGSRGQRH